MALPSYKLWTQLSFPFATTNMFFSTLFHSMFRFFFQKKPVFLLTQVQTVDSVIVPVRNYKHVPPPVPENHTPNFFFPKERLCSSLRSGKLRTQFRVPLAGRPRPLNPQHPAVLFDPLNGDQVGHEGGG